MDSLTAEKIERDVPGCIIIDSEERGLKYLFDGDKGRLVIAGHKGFTMLTINQARALLRELGGVLENRYFFTERKSEK